MSGKIEQERAKSGERCKNYYRLLQNRMQKLNENLRRGQRLYRDKGERGNTSNMPTSFNFLLKLEKKSREN